MNPRVRVHPPAWAPFRMLGLCAAVAACGHSDAFTSPPYGTDAPFDPSPPARLTFNPLTDREAAWLPDGSGILYSAQQLDRRDHDLCLALLPPDGGRQRALTCDLSSAGVDSTNAIVSAAPAADGRLAFVGASSSIGSVSPFTEGIAIAPTVDARGAATILSRPYTIPGEPSHNHMGTIRWLGAGKLVFLGGNSAFITDCLGCPHDTVVANLKVVMLDAAAGASPTAVEGTDLPSGVSAGASPDEIYYTADGDSRVFLRTLSTGAVTVAYDFGAAGIARDVHVVGSRMTVVVGGHVVFGINPTLGPTQRDSGGVVHVVDLGTGANQSLDQPALLFRRPALAPDGGRLVAEGFPLTFVPTATGVDTIVASVGDLYLFSAP